MILAIAWRELRTLFLSPLAWAILAVIQFIIGFIFLGLTHRVELILPQLAGMEQAPGITQMIAPSLFRYAAVLLLLVVPLITMRVFAEERRNKTLTLLFSAPVSMAQIVFGKYLGVIGFLATVVLLFTLMPLSLAFGTRIDAGLILSGTLGLAFVVSSFAAVGVFMSALTQHPAVAAIGTFGALLFFWILDWSRQGPYGDSVFGYLSLLNHYEPFLDGLFESTDALYHLLLIATFLVLTIRRLDADRIGG